MKPLGDDWLFWDPECIHRYPESTVPGQTEFDPEVRMISPKRQVEWRDIGSYVAGMAFGVAATLIVMIGLSLWAVHEHFF